MENRSGTRARDRATTGRALLGVAALALFVAGGLAVAGGLVTEAERDPTGLLSTTDTPADPESPRNGAETTREPPEAAPSGVRSLANASVTIASDEFDELGHGVAVGDANGDGETDVLLGAPLRNATGRESGAAYLFYGPLEAGDLTVADADVTFHGETEWTWAGNAVQLADVNGDGTDDVVIGAPLAGAAGPSAGAVYVEYGDDLSGTIPLDEADARLLGPDERSFAGYSVAAADVVDGPEADLLVGAPRANASGAESGAAYLVSGGDLSGETSLVDADATFVGAGAGDHAGHAVDFAGDVDGDGRIDPAIGARRNDSAGSDAGAAYVLLGPLEDRRSLADAAVTLTGAAAGDHAGLDVAGAGDVNDDGYADVLVGAPFENTGGNDAGAAYVVYGGEDLPASTSLRDAGDALVGAAAGDRAGYSVAAAGDATCDGRDDLLIGAPENDTGGDDAGAAYLVSGARVGADDTLDDAELALTGAAPGDQVGRAVRLAAFPRDRGAGLLVGAPFGDTGAVHVVYHECRVDSSRAGPPDGAR